VDNALQLANVDWFRARNRHQCPQQDTGVRIFFNLRTACGSLASELVGSGPDFRKIHATCGCSPVPAHQAYRTDPTNLLSRLIRVNWNSICTMPARIVASQQSAAAARAAWRRPLQAIRNEC
jgi:hypothetical protein